MFGQILKENRMNAGIGLRDFAGRIGISPGYLSDLENEKVAPPSEKLILAMARTLGVEKDVLLKAAEKVDPRCLSMLPMSRGQPISCVWLRSRILITATGKSSVNSPGLRVSGNRKRKRNECQLAS